MIFLQTMQDPTAYIIVFLFFAMLAIIIQVLIIRWVFRIDTQVNNQNAMIFLLAKLCEKSNVSDDDIEIIMKHFKIKGYK